jgi:peptide/nickel transport system ATP-binding protein
MTNLLDVRDLKIEFRTGEVAVMAVDGVSFRVPPRKTVALVGESGSGKSVISQAIMGILPANGFITGGEILFRDPQGGQQPSGEAQDLVRLQATDSPWAGTAMRRIRGGRISIIFQEPMTSLSPVHTIGDQVSEALRLHRAVADAEARELTVEMLRLVGFPDPARALARYSFELSGGLRQRAMIAMALICRPALLIADEPTTALDVTIQAQILKLVRDLQAELGMAMLIITHDLGVVANMAEEIIVLYNGRVVEQGTLDDIFRRAEHPYLKALLRAVPRFHMAPGERLVPIREISLTGAALKGRPAWPTDADKAGPLLEVQGVSKRYGERNQSEPANGEPGGTLAVDDVGFSIARGECLGLVGESGCGKTTLSKMILKAVRPDAGAIRVNDRGRMIDVLGLAGADLLAYRRRVQLVFQDPFGSLNPRMTVFDILSEPLVIHGLGSRTEMAERVIELMTLVGLDPRFLRRYPHSFSGGQRQRIAIARALALQPELLICDEPVSALDVSIQAQILNLLKDLQAALGLTYLFVSHNLAVVHYLAHRIAVMCAGQLVEIAPVEELFKNPVHPYTKALLAAVPEPDPRFRLDLGALMEGRASIPAAWPAPYTVAPGLPRPRMIDQGGGHFVRASAAP